MQNLTGHVAWITGAGTGIGESAALKLGAAGCTMSVTDEDKARILQSDDLGDLVLFVAQQPPHVTLNEILITPTYNRFA